MSKKTRYTFIIVTILMIGLTINGILAAANSSVTSKEERGNLKYGTYLVSPLEEDVENSLEGHNVVETVVEGEAKSGEYDNDKLNTTWWLFCSDYGVELPSYDTSKPIKGTNIAHGTFGFSSEYKNAAVLDYGEKDLSEEEKEALGLVRGKRGYKNFNSSLGYRYYYTRELITEGANVTARVTENAKDDERYTSKATNVKADLPWNVAYVLASTDELSAGSRHYSKEQYALWYALGAQNLGHQSEEADAEARANMEAGKELADEAEAFANYKSTYTEPSVDDNNDYKYRYENDELILGPIIINYAESTDENYTFSEIDPDSCKVVGVTYTGQEVELKPGQYELMDENGGRMVDATGISSGEPFYIVLDYDNPIYTSIKYIKIFEIEIKQLDVKAGIYKVDGMKSRITNWKESEIEKVKCTLMHYWEEDGYYDVYESNNGTHIKGDTTTHQFICNDRTCYYHAFSHETESKYYFLLKDTVTETDAQELYILRLAEKIWVKYKLTITFDNPPSETPSPTPGTPSPTPGTGTPTPTPGTETPTPHRTYIDLGGKVWVDIPTEDKNKEANGILDGSDYGRKNVLVTLYFEDGTKVVPGQRNVSSERFKNDIYTDENGNYMFYDLPMGEKYYVEFTYDGMSYEPTKYLAGESESTYISDPNNFTEETSKVEEEMDREAFNRKFEEISGNGSGSLSGGYTSGKSTSVTPLRYKSKVFSKNFESRLITTDNEADLEENAKATGKALTDYEIKARSKLDYPFTNEYTIWSSENTDELAYLRHINLGLKPRPKADFALQTQIKAGATTIKDKEKVVFFKSNVRDEDLKIDGTATEDEYIKQEIAATDYNWRAKFTQIYGDNGQQVTGYVEEDQLNVYVLYRIVIQNQCESENNYGVITGVVDYFDNRLEMVPNADRQKVSSLFTTNGFTVPNGAISWVENANTTVNWTQKGNVGNYTQIETTGLNLEVGKDGNLSVIYLILKVRNNGDVLYTGLENGKNGIENIAEIASYKVLNKDGSIAGLVDRDSAPYNATPGNKSTYEDDTDPAPMFQLVINWEPRKISGNVWDDVNKDAVLNGEKGIKNVEVELIEYVYKDGQLNAVVRPGIEIEGKNLSVDRNDNVRTDENGNYEFYVEGGNYAIRFTFGDMVMLKDGSSKKYNAQDYQAAQPYTALSSMSAYNKQYSRAFATEAELKSYLDGDLKLVIDDLEGSQQEYETRNWSEETQNNNSSARERADIRADIIRNTVELTNSKAELLNKLNGENGLNDDEAKALTGNDNTNTPNYTYMEALSDIVVISSNDLVKTNKVINLGLQEREKASIELEKKVTRIVLKSNDGKTLIDTDDTTKQTNLAKNPTTDGEPLSDIQTTLMYLNALLMEGATIDIDYEIRVKNDAANDDRLSNYVYVDNAEVKDTETMEKLREELNSNPYKFNLTGLDSSLPVRANTIYDYVNINLEYRSADNGAGEAIWTKVYDNDDNGMDNIPEGWLTTDVKNTIPRTAKRVSKVLATNDKAVTRNPETGNLNAGKELNIAVHLGISLAEDTGAEVDNELVYQNCAEIVEIYSAAGRRDYDSVPGNYIPYSEDTEPDSDLTGTTTIIPPTGQNRIYYVIAIISATIIIVGVVLIKKKVLKK